MWHNSPCSTYIYPSTRQLSEPKLFDLNTTQLLQISINWFICHSTTNRRLDGLFIETHVVHTKPKHSPSQTIKRGGVGGKYVELVQSTYDGRRMPPEVGPDVRVRFPIFGANPSIDTAATVGTADTNNNNNKRSSSIAPIIVDIASPCQPVSRKIWTGGTLYPCLTPPKNFLLT
jgi:hypothetical protein